ncbi:MAG: tetratricopeptide repeat protein [Planctomycetota bacterium]|nr:tetratricopeptide repeat protein [Planctomycetota bacterium]
MLKKTHTTLVFLAIISLCTESTVGEERGSAAGPARGPVVARLSMTLAVGEEVIDVIDKGDLLTVLEDQGETYLILTFKGKRGLVDKVNALSLAESVEIYNELIEQNSKEGRLYTLRASAWWARGDEQSALDDFDQAIKLGYRQADAYTSRGMFHAALGNYRKAVADYSQAIKLDAKDAAPWINRAAVWMTIQKYELAIKDYNEAVRRNPKDANTYQQRAVARKLNRQLDLAVKDFSRAIKLSPRHVPAVMGRGYAWYQLAEYEKAVVDFTRAIKLDPKSAQAYNNRGFNYQLLGNFQAALADYDKAIELAPTLTLALQNKAWLLASVADAKIRDGKQAVDIATKACELSNYKLAGDLKALAAALAADGQFEKAIGWQEKAIELLPEEQKEAGREALAQYADNKPLRISRYAND